MRFALSLVALATVATPVAAEVSSSDTTTVPVRISYADIDVTSAEGRAVLEQRFEAKLRKACTIENTRYVYGRKIVDQKCVADARAQAMEAVQQVAAREARGSRQASAN